MPNTRFVSLPGPFTCLCKLNRLHIYIACRLTQNVTISNYKSRYISSRFDTKCNFMSYFGEDMHRMNVECGECATPCVSPSKLFGDGKLNSGVGGRTFEVDYKICSYRSSVSPCFMRYSNGTSLSSSNRTWGIKNGTPCTVCRGQECVELYIHSPIRLHCVVLI
jgi:hypothetical protein